MMLVEHDTTVVFARTSEKENKENNKQREFEKNATRAEQINKQTNRKTKVSQYQNKLAEIMRLLNVLQIGFGQQQPTINYMHKLQLLTQKPNN